MFLNSLAYIIMHVYSVTLPYLVYIPLHVKDDFQSVLRMLRVCFHFCFEFVDTLHFGDSVHEVFESAITGR